MADDARISTAYLRHPKTVKLRRRLGDTGVLGHIGLMLWTAENRHDGDLIGMTDEDVEIAADWSGEAGALVSTLVDIRFLDGQKGAYRLHDWAVHQPYIAARPQRSKAARDAAIKKWSSKTPEQRREAARHAANAKWHHRVDDASEQHASSTDDASALRASRTDDASGERPPYPTLPYPAQLTVAPRPQTAAPNASTDDVRLQELKNRVRAEIESQWNAHNRGAKLPWDMKATRNLNAVLKANPSWTFDLFARCVRHRFQSEQNHSEAPFQWLAKLTNYLGGPLDRFGQPIGYHKANSADKTNGRNNGFHDDGDHSKYCEGADVIYDNSNGA